MPLANRTIIPVEVSNDGGKTWRTNQVEAHSGKLERRFDQENVLVHIGADSELEVIEDQGESLLVRVKQGELSLIAFKEVLEPNESEVWYKISKTSL